jgi:hypothetical protein
VLSGLKELVICWFEPQLEGSPAPCTLLRFSNVLYVPRLASNLLSLISLNALCYTFLLVLVAISLSAKMAKSSSRPVTGRRIGQLLGLHAPQTAYAATVAPLTLQLWHEHLNHRALDAVEHAVQHVDGLTIDSQARLQHR